MTVLLFGFTNNSSYASDHLLDEQQLAKVLQFCQNNDQASDLCYLLTQDNFDNQHLYQIHDLKLDANHIDYALSAQIISIPVFFYLPELAKLAKNNMIFASVIALITGAIIFKKYYDGLLDSLLMKAQVDYSSSFASKALTELKSSKRYQYYSQKGPEYEDDKLIFFLRDQRQQDLERESIQIEEYQDFMKTAQKWYENTHITSKYSYFVEFVNLLETYPKTYHFNLNDSLKKLSQFHLNHLPKFEKRVVQETAQRFFNEAKLASSELTYNNIVKRNAFFKRPSKELQNTFSKEDGKIVWNALLLEHISHLELLEKNKDPQFEQDIYVPFLQAEKKSLQTKIIQIRKYIQIQTLQKITDKVAKDIDDSVKDLTNQVKDSFNIIEKLMDPITESPSNTASSQIHILPSVYLNYQDLTVEQLNFYLDARLYLLSSILHEVNTRINVWNRKQIYKFLPDIAQSDQAYKDWSELFELTTDPLLLVLLDLSKIDQE